jgi:hypothetical protein
MALTPRSIVADKKFREAKAHSKQKLDISKRKLVSVSEELQEIFREKEAVSLQFSYFAPGIVVDLHVRYSRMARLAS